MTRLRRREFKIRQVLKTSWQLWRPALASTLLLIVLQGTALAAPAFPPQQSSGSVGLEGTISSAPPSQGATIVSPANGASFSSLPITVAGLCPKGVLVKVFSNNVFVGSAVCTNGSYSIQISLFAGQNDLVVRVYDALDQAGPDSNTVTVNFNDLQTAQFGSRVSLTSIYARLGANPGQEIDWPIILSGGTGPYAVSVDWGDGSPPDLLSESFAGTFTIKHVYKTAGVYNVIVKASDKNGTIAFLQLVGVADGAIQGGNGSSKSTNNTTTQVKVLWWPAVAMVPLIVVTFWIGRRHELYSLRKQLEKNRNQSGN